ncbi:rhodanese-like domain-containing protein [Patescibacteria group bacterium]
MIKNISVKDFSQDMKVDGENLEVIDVREPEEYEEIRIKGSKLIPIGEIVKRIKEIDWAKKIILVCRSGARSTYAGELIRDNGYADKEVYNLNGGIAALNVAGCDCLEK